MYTVPGKVDNVTVVGLGRIQNNRLYQSISWSRPPHHTSQLNYTIKYGPSSEVDTPTHPSVNTTNTTEPSVNLTLPIPNTPVTYYVWVAAVSDAGQGEYSQRIQINYTGKSINQLSHYVL